MRATPRSGYVYADAVGGIVPGYGGHRPGSQNVHGYTAFGGVPPTLESDRAPGQGWSIDNRSTTSFEEVGHVYKGHSPTKAEVFRHNVSGVKVGYAGHTPGASQHIGSRHLGNVPMNDFSGTQGAAAVPLAQEPPASSQHHFVRAADIHEATAAVKQARELASQTIGSAPFGADGSSKGRYATETSRTAGPRDQVTRLDLSPVHYEPPKPHSPASINSRSEGSSLFDSESHFGRSQRDSMPRTPPMRPTSPYMGSAPPRGGQPPREQRMPHPDQPAVGYAGHRRGERDLTDLAVRGQVEAYNHTGAEQYYEQARRTTAQGTATPPRSALASPKSRGASPPASNRSAGRPTEKAYLALRPTVVGDRSTYTAASPPRTPPGTANAGAKHASRLHGAATPPSAGGRQQRPGARQAWPAQGASGTAGGVGRQPQFVDESLPPTDHASPSLSTRRSSGTTPPASNRSHGGASAYSSASIWEPPSWDQLRSTPAEDVYRSHVGGVKLGYSGHIPSRQEHVGSSNYGDSNFAPPRQTGQRDHRTRTLSEYVAPDKSPSRKAAGSVVGYNGHLPTHQEAHGQSYWRSEGGPLGAARTAGMSTLGIAHATSTDLWRGGGDHLLTA